MERTGTSTRALLELLRRETGVSISESMMSLVLRGGRRCSVRNAMAIQALTGVPFRTLTQWPKVSQWQKLMKDAASKGRLHVGRPGKRKIATEQLDEVDALLASGATQVAVARAFGVTKGWVNRYVHGSLRRFDRPSAPRRRKRAA